MFWADRLDSKRGQYVRDQPWPWANVLLAAETVDDVMRALEAASDYARAQLKPLARLVVKVLRERAFPRTQRAQLDFLAESLAARGEVSARRSRDICQQERLKAERGTHIISYEFKIECTCGFKGFSKVHGCPKCGARIQVGLSSIYGGGLF